MKKGILIERKTDETDTQNKQLERQTKKKLDRETDGRQPKSRQRNKQAE